MQILSKDRRGCRRFYDLMVDVNEIIVNKKWDREIPCSRTRTDIYGCISVLGPPGRVAQSVGHPTHKSGVLGSIPGLATYFRFSFRFFKKGSCQLLAKVCARSTG